MGAVLFSVMFLVLSSAASMLIKKQIQRYFLLSVISVAAAAAALPAFKVLFGGVGESMTLHCGYPIGELVLSLDPVSAFFIIVIFAGSLFTSVFSFDYLKDYDKKGKVKLLNAAFLLLTASMAAVSVIENVFAFIVAWEVMSLSSFAAILFESEKEEVRNAAIEYIVYMHIGATLITVGFIIMYAATGSVNFSGMSSFLSGRGRMQTLVFFLLFFGFGVKAGFVPFHNWLPKAHPACLSSISAYMSGIMLKMGIYGIIRITMLFENISLLSIFAVIAVSSFTVLIGIIMASLEKDMKRILAFSSMENMGIIGLGIGIGMAGKYFGNQFVSAAGYAGALLHVLNHSLFKPLLFFGAGRIYSRYHTRSIEELGGVIKQMPYTSVLMIAGAAAISGMPVLNGFVSEFIIYMASLAGMAFRLPQLALLSACVIIVLSFAGAIAVICFTRIIGISLLGRPRKPSQAVPEEKFGASLSVMSFMAAASLMIGLLPQYALKMVYMPSLSIVKEAEAAFFRYAFPEAASLSKAMLIFVLLAVSAYLVRKAFLRGRIREVERVWGCGYSGDVPKSQYSGYSYSAPFREIISPLNAAKNADAAEAGLTGSVSKTDERRSDFVENFMIKPSINLLKKLFDRFSGIQTGSTQRYLLMGMIFLLLSLLAIIWT